jgi:tryptophan-rich sensory protein
VNPIFVAATVAIFVGLLGGSLTDTGAWYQSLEKPWWQPPDWAFGPAWTVIFALWAMAAVYAWRGARNRAQREWLIGVFAANGFFNVLWSMLFFTVQRPDWALLEVPLLWLSVLVGVLVFWRNARTASYYLLPYLAWVTFAAYLNWTVVQLNAPFG